MAFKFYNTYGRYRHRVVKTEVWISPETNKLFSSQDSSTTTDDESETSQKSLLDITERSPETTNASTNQKTTSLTNCDKQGTRQDQSITNSNVDHSTPLVSRLQPSDKNHCELTDISPLTTSDIQYNQATTRYIDSPLIVSNNITQETECSQGFCGQPLSPVLSTGGSVCQSTAGQIDSPLLFQEDNHDRTTGNSPVTRSRKPVGRRLDSTSSEDECTQHKQCSSGETSKTKNAVTENIQSISTKMKNLKLMDGTVQLDPSDVLKASKSFEAKKKESLGSEPLKKENCVHENGTPTPVPCTPVQQRLKNETKSNLSFVEALTPLRSRRKKTLSANEKILLQCGQEKPLKFTDVFTDKMLEKCVKVGEGTYGEVYKSNDGIEDVAVKVIPIEGKFTVNDEEQKTFEEMLPEIVISKELSDLGNFKNNNSCPNFIKVKRVMLIQDSYPDKFIQEWDTWAKINNSENQRPDIFPQDQYFIVFEFNDGGQDLESFQFKKMQEALSVLQQIVLSFSVAEQLFMFEHRDLHWGNVLIKRTRCQNIQYKLKGKDIRVKSYGVFVSVIDFTLSRLTKDGVTVFCDLSKDPNIFTGKGDYQFEVYRLMRQANNDDWKAHVPYSNVLWLRYLLDKIINSKQYPTKDKTLLRNFRAFLRRVLSYDSSIEALQDDILQISIS